MFLCAVTVFTACETESIQPTVEIMDIEEWELGLATSRVIVSVEVDNPNVFGGTLVEAEYRLEINGVGVGSGTLEAEYAIAPAGISRVLLPLELDHSALLESILGGSLDGVDYSIRGTARLETIAGEFERPFEKTGRTNIPLMIESLIN